MSNQLCECPDSGLSIKSVVFSATIDSGTLTERQSKGQQKGKDLAFFKLWILRVPFSSYM